MFKQEGHMKELIELAKRIAEDECGRDWSDCGAYERQSFIDEASRRFYQNQ